MDLLVTLNVYWNLMVFTHITHDRFCSNNLFASFQISAERVCDWSKKKSNLTAAFFDQS